MSYINSCTGLQLTAEQVAGLLSRMALTAQASPSGDSVHVEVPPSRSDILHDCDVMEVWPAPSPDHLALPKMVSKVAGMRLRGPPMGALVQPVQQTDGHRPAEKRTLQDDIMKVPVVIHLPTPSQMGMWDGKEQPQALCLACLSCDGLML